jgi:superfamily II DNA helicase RecQ
MKYIESCLNESITLATNKLANSSLSSSASNGNQAVSQNENKNCGIIYCRSRDACVQLAGRLISKNISAKAYHAGLKNSERDEIQNEW